MRRSRMIAVSLMLLLGAVLVGRQFLQRRRTRRQNADTYRPPLPSWAAATTLAPDPAVVTGTAEHTHNQSDALTQPQEPAEAPSSTAMADPAVESEAAVETGTGSAGAAGPAVESEAAVETDTGSDSAADPVVESEAAVEIDTGSDSAAEVAPPDDLIRIEGIGPKISTIVVAAGITSFAELAGIEVARLETILNEAGIHTANPSTWPDQAHLAAQGKWQELQELQDRIKNGRLEA